MPFFFLVFLFQKVAVFWVLPLMEVLMWVLGFLVNRSSHDGDLGRFGICLQRLGAGIAGSLARTSGALRQKLTRRGCEECAFAGGMKCGKELVLLLICEFVCCKICSEDLSEVGEKDGWMFRAPSRRETKKKQVVIVGLLSARSKAARAEW